MMFTRHFASLAVVVSLAAQIAVALPGASWQRRADDAQTSLTLDPSQIQPNLALDGQAIPDAGQVPSITSTNNFINFCATQNVPLTNGQQIRTGSCNPTTIGRVLATTNMPSSKFQFPGNLETIKADTKFTIQMSIKHLVTGNFVNAQANYYAAPQQVDGSGDLIGHSHVVIEKLNDGFQQTAVMNPNVFVFFKGLNSAAQGGILTADVTGGLPAGTYRLASINAAANHQPALVSVAQHGSLDDGVYFEVTADGKQSADLAKLVAASTGAPPAKDAGAAAPPAKDAGAAAPPAKDAGAAAPPAKDAGNQANLPIGKDGKIQLFTGNLGGAPPDVVPQGSGFATNGQPFGGINAARASACDVQKSSCDGLASGGKATAQACTDQVNACKKANGVF